MAATAATFLAAWPADKRTPAETAAAAGDGSGLLGCRRTLIGNSLDPDLDLVERCLNGDETSWENMVKSYTRRVYSLCYRFTGKESEAQDLTQEVFLRIFRSLKSFRAGEGSLSVWITRVARNLLIDHYRRSRMDRMSDSIEDQLPVLEEKTALESRTDGMLAGPNLASTRAIAEAASLEVIASGGVTTLDDIRAVRMLEPSGVVGCIVGRALYSGTIDLTEAIALATEF